jgi:hypothetical protein
MELMSYNQEKYNSKIRLFLGLGLLLGTVCFMYFIQYYFLHFSASKIIPGLTTAAAANGFRLAYKIYKKTKNLARAIQVFSAWGGVSLLISIGGDWLINQLLSNHIDVLASW